MTEPEDEQKPKSLIGPTALLVIFLIDVGLIILGWYVHQNRKRSYDGSGLSLSKTPESQQQPRTFTPLAEETVDEDRLSLVVKEPLRRKKRPGASQAPSADPGTRIPPENRNIVRKAVLFFYDLKKDPRFKNSPAIAEWKREFLSYPELQAADNAYRKDGDAIRFMIKMVRSPNFHSMAARHLIKPDIQTFVNEMSQTPAVTQSAPSFLQDPGVSSAAQALGILSKAPSAQPGQPAPEQPYPSRIQEGLKRARENPRLQDILDPGGASKIE